MSRLTILGLRPGDPSATGIETIEELRNSWLGAPLIWRAMAHRYFNNQSTFHENPDLVWKLAQDSEVSLIDRAVLMMTFDRVYIAERHYARASMDLRTWVRSHQIENPTHLLRIARILDDKPSFPAVGFWITSVSRNPFWGEFDEELDDYGSIDWETTYELYDQLNEWLEEEE